MGAREDFMAMRRAANHAAMAAGFDQPVLAAALATTLRKASANETSFVRLAKAGVQNELIDLAWAVLGEPRPDGPAVQPAVEEVAT